MLDRSQYSPRSNSAGCGGCEEVSSWGGECCDSGPRDRDDVGATGTAADASLMLWAMVWTSASVGAAPSSWCSWSGAWCPFGRCSVVPLIFFLSPPSAAHWVLRKGGGTLPRRVLPRNWGRRAWIRRSGPGGWGAWEPACSAGCGDHYLGTKDVMGAAWVRPSAARQRSKGRMYVPSGTPTLAKACKRVSGPLPQDRRWLLLVTPSTLSDCSVGSVCPHPAEGGSRPPKCPDCGRLIRNRKKPTRPRGTCPKGPMRPPAVARLMEQVYQGATRAES